MRFGVTRWILGLVAGTAMLGLAPGMAGAQEPAEKAKNWIENAGLAIEVGGGVTNFAEDATRDMTDVGGYWDARVVVGQRMPIGFEAAYVGAAHDIQALGLDDSAALVKNGLEGNLRLNLPMQREEYSLTPYVFAGLGWGHYSLVNDDFNTSDVREDDNTFAVPLGAGVSVGRGSFLVDARFTYRPEFDDDMLGRNEPEDMGLNHWQLGAMLGYRF